MFNLFKKKVSSYAFASNALKVCRSVLIHISRGEFSVSPNNPEDGTLSEHEAIRVMHYETNNLTMINAVNNSQDKVKPLVDALDDKSANEAIQYAVSMLTELDNWWNHLVPDVNAINRFSDLRDMHIKLNEMWRDTESGKIIMIDDFEERG
ncbi:hypothetical protein R7Z44_14510 [Vibrio sp. 1409]|uniref:hypothetical protein n=1 Tax=Vibrio sp. 1409 TaxID=3074558 RepID=UPI001CF240B8|nr:hypothetical protein [Vibrio alginolyticus]MDW2258890.1 hypothetical protein [Vibrio sp. 1409]